MKLIAALYDRNFTNSELLSAKKPRLTVRTILFNEDEKIALIYVSKYKIYAFPGGGIEEGESLEKALKREVLEETGCNCDIVGELGCVYENRGQLDYTQQSFYFITRKLGEAIKPKLTQDEENNNIKYNWYTMDEVDELLKLSAHETMQQKFLQARDMAALNELMKSPI